MLLAAQERGWSLFYMEQQDLYQNAGRARARMKPLKVLPTRPNGSSSVPKWTAVWMIWT